MGYWSTHFIQYHHTGSGNRFADGDRDTCKIVVRDFVDCRERCVLGRTVAVDEARRRQDVERFPDVPDAEHVAARDEDAKRRQCFRALIDHRLEYSGCEPQDAHAVTMQALSNLVNREDAGCGNCQAGAVQQRTPDFQG